MDSKDGLVAPVWSDSGVVTMGEVTYSYELPTIEFEIDNTGPLAVVTRYWVNGALVNLGKPSDPNAKPALPALTRVGGNKRGPGWCDE